MEYVITGLSTKLGPYDGATAYETFDTHYQ